MVWLTEEAFPQASAKLHVLTIIKLFGQSPGVITPVGSTITSPSQLSIAVKLTGAGTFATQETVISAGASGASGAVVSFTVMV